LRLPIQTTDRASTRIRTQTFSSYSVLLFFMDVTPSFGGVRERHNRGAELDCP